MMGFDRPILHGLCTFGFAARHLIKLVGNDNPNSLKKLKARFSKAVYPGDTLKTEVWNENEHFIYQVRVMGRNNDEIVLGDGYAYFSHSPHLESSIPSTSIPPSISVKNVESNEIQSNLQSVDSFSMTSIEGIFDKFNQVFDSFTRDQKLNLIKKVLLMIQALNSLYNFCLFNILFFRFLDHFNSILNHLKMTLIMKRF